MQRRSTHLHALHDSGDAMTSALMNYYQAIEKALSLIHI